MNHTGLFSYILTRNVKNKKMRCIPIAAALCLAAMFIFAVMSLTRCADKRLRTAERRNLLRRFLRPISEGLLLLLSALPAMLSANLNRLCSFLPGRREHGNFKTAKRLCLRRPFLILSVVKSSYLQTAQSCSEKIRHKEHIAMSF